MGERGKVREVVLKPDKKDACFRESKQRCWLDSEDDNKTANICGQEFV